MPKTKEANKKTEGVAPSSSSTSNSSDQTGQQTLLSLYDIDDFAAHHCGYCNQDGNISVGMSSDTMQIEDYQTLIDRGWRRSGTYIYKPQMDKTCCPLYAIRCDAMNFKLRKSQKIVLKRMRKFLETGVKTSGRRRTISSSSAAASDKSANLIKIDNSKFTNLNENNNVVDKKSAKTNALLVMDYFLGQNVNIEEAKSKPVNEILNLKRTKAKHRRLFKKLCKLKEQNQLASPADIEKNLKRNFKFGNQDRDSLESFLKLSADKPLVNRLDIKLVRSWPPSKEFQRTLNEEHELYAKYQTNIHNDSLLECNKTQFQRFLCTSPLLMQSHAGPLIKQPDVSKVDTSIAGNLEQLGYGSFHQQYRINDKLVAVGVVDILNHCVSSVYFFYDPEYDFLKMGTYSALREIALVRQLVKIDPNLKWYYLGFYAHNCRKMRYKGLFYPSYLLCPEVYTWHPIENCILLLEKNKYSRFAPTAASEAVGSSSSSNVVEIIRDQDSNDDIEEVRIRIKFRDNETKVVKFNDFCQFLNESFVPQFKRLIEGYCKLFGKKFSHRVLIKF